MPISATLFSRIEDAAIAKLLAQSIVCVAYEDRDLDQIPLATLSLLPGEIEPGGAQQAYGIEWITWTYRYYVDLTEGTAQAQLNMKAGIIATFNALAADPTLGLPGVETRLQSGRVYPVTTNGGPELMFEAPFKGRPRPNIG